MYETRQICIIIRNVTKGTRLYPVDLPLTYVYPLSEASEACQARSPIKVFLAS